jgi:shikimate kinase
LLARDAAPVYCSQMAALKRTVALIGMMGAGKSSVGRRLARRLGAPFRDADSEIEAAAGSTVAEIFTRFGEAQFREGERRVILRLLAQSPHILATGGGAMLDTATRAAIAESAVSVWLRVPMDLLLVRVERRDTRPLLKGGNTREKLERLLAEREPLYSQANVIIDAADGPHSVAVNRILSALTSRGDVQ